MLSSFAGGGCDMFISCHGELRSFELALVSSRIVPCIVGFRVRDLWIVGCEIGGRGKGAYLQRGREG